jgi:hypothetical protein
MGSAPVKRTMSASARRGSPPRARALGEVENGKEEGSLTYGAGIKPAASVAGFLFDEESLRIGYQMS